MANCMFSCWSKMSSMCLWKVIKLLCALPGLPWNIHCMVPMLSVVIKIFVGGVGILMLTSSWISSAATSRAFISVSYTSTCSPIKPFTEVISFPFLYATTLYPVLHVPLLYDRDPSVYMNMMLLSPLYSSYRLVWWWWWWISFVTPQLHGNTAVRCKWANWALGL